MIWVDKPVCHDLLFISPHFEDLMHITPASGAGKGHWVGFEALPPLRDCYLRVLERYTDPVFFTPCLIEGKFAIFVLHNGCPKNRTATLKEKKAYLTKLGLISGAKNGF